MIEARHAGGVLAAATLISSVVAANWATSRFGFVPVGFGQLATAGTYAAGIALAARDAIQDAIGRQWMLTCLTAAAALSYVLADARIALASAVAFAVSELLDFAVYSPIRQRGHLGDRRWAVAVIASGVVGAVADTVIFIGFIGKTWATLSYVAIGKALAGAVLRQPHQQPA